MHKVCYLSAMATKYAKRDIEKTLKQAASQFPAFILTGPRQSGKTTVLKHLFSKTHRYVTLDDPESRLQANDDPKYFLKNYPPPVIVDEIQYAPKLLPFLKIRIDEERSRKGQFLLTGSQIFPLMAGVSESLAGRIAVLSLLSFSVKESTRSIRHPFNVTMVKNMILKGGYPEVALAKRVDQKLWFAGYLQTYLERDVRQLRQVGDLTDFQRFLEMLAALNGQILNLSGLSRDLGVAVNTVKSWISVLEATYQVVLIKPYYRNRGKRLVKSSKVYFTDTGFLCYLNGLTTPDQVFKGPASGQLFETFVLGEILRSFYAKGEIPRIYWWRTSHGQEVDFIVETKGKLIPIEVKLGSKQNQEMIRELVSFVSLFREDIKQGLLINMADRSLVLHEKIRSLPYEQFIRQPVV